MARHTLYAYVDGADLEEVAGTLKSEFEQFIALGDWRAGRPWIVNQRESPQDSLSPEDMPDWDLGPNLDLPDPGHEPMRKE